MKSRRIILNSDGVNRVLATGFIRHREPVKGVQRNNRISIGKNLVMNIRDHRIVDYAPLQPGDRLWIRESARVLEHSWQDVDGYWGRAIKVEYIDGSVSDWILRPSRLAPVAVGKLMPGGCFREASRITLEVDTVKIDELLETWEYDLKVVK